MEHAQESEVPMLARVGHALTRTDSVATRRAVIGNGEAGEGRGEVRHWPSKPRKNRFSLDQTNPKPLRQLEQRKMRQSNEATSRQGKEGDVAAVKTADKDLFQTGV